MAVVVVVAVGAVGVVGEVMTVGFAIVVVIARTIGFSSNSSMSLPLVAMLRLANVAVLLFFVSAANALVVANGM